ncbi:hypothetical protein [Mycolicibacter hiberniae]|uniref:Uncharacterized protein n=1 Tax=Mycolicibacter hiberniae TaxID=29314 RepID=A0A7I7WXY5_9MYCO|nr:hypothetical protein [Mycolicibacter hiberniae]MCV7084983.1 hypothetical protein [Mycolicibacter hiberniae]ORV73100.1 hypothetical protein AWC09_02625 [Mycolicibacter hiberniae]BBZ22364.1 hypothetical protein MHIB_07820 [Mycolicibacter hiberniae]
MMLSDLMFWVFALCLAGGVVLSFLSIDRNVQRRWYWSLACLAGAAGVLSTYPTWEGAAARGLMPTVSMVVMAYVWTPHIKIGGKIYALTITDPDPDDEPATTDPTQQEIDPHPDSYSGLLTATTLWWSLVVLGAIAAGNVYFATTGEGEIWVGLMGGTFFAMLCAITAYGDASWRYPIARGQYIPFVVASVITAGVLPLLYLPLYYMGKRRPLRRKQSMEYLVHPRHRK